MTVGRHPASDSTFLGMTPLGFDTTRRINRTGEVPWGLGTDPPLRIRQSQYSHTGHRRRSENTIIEDGGETRTWRFRHW